MGRLRVARVGERSEISGKDVYITGLFVKGFDAFLDELLDRVS
jgi:hypothetical protein